VSIRFGDPEWHEELERRCAEARERSRERNRLELVNRSLSLANERLRARVRALMERHERDRQTIDRLQRQLAEARAIINVRRGVA